jgi:hypothetical protein
MRAQDETRKQQQGTVGIDDASHACTRCCMGFRVAGIYALGTRDNNAQAAAKALNKLLCSMGFADEMDERSIWDFAPCWPEDVWSGGSHPKVLVVIKQKRRYRP